MVEIPIASCSRSRQIPPRAQHFGHWHDHASYHSDASTRPVTLAKANRIYESIDVDNISLVYKLQAKHRASLCILALRPCIPPAESLGAFSLLCCQYQYTQISKLRHSLKIQPWQGLAYVSCCLRHCQWLKWEIFSPLQPVRAHPFQSMLQVWQHHLLPDLIPGRNPRQAAKEM